MEKLRSRILLYICVFSAIVLAGCSSQESADLGQKTYNAIVSGFMYSDVFDGFGPSLFTQSGTIRESFGLYSLANNDLILSDIRIGMTQDHAGDQKLSSLSFSGTLEDKKSNDVFVGDATIHYIANNENSYIKWADGTISLGEGNTESFILSMIINSIRDQWMLIDDNALINEDYFSLTIAQDIAPIIGALQSLFDSELLTVAQNTIGGLYPLTLITNHAHIQNLYTLVGIPYDQQAISFQGYIQTQPTPQLVIQKFNDSNNGFTLEGYVGIRHGQLTLERTGSSWDIAWEEKRNSITTKITHHTNNRKIREVDTKISQKSLNDSLISLAYDGQLSVAFPGQSSTQGLVTFPIAGLYSISIVDDMLFVAPSRYVLMSQLFGDEYGILSLLESEQ